MNREGQARLPLVRRREFLIWSAVGALAPWVEGIARAAPAGRARAMPAKAVEPMSIGYVDGSADFDRLDRLPWDASGAQRAVYGAPLAVVSAAQLPVGDQRFAGHASARVTVHGLYPAAAAASRGIDSVDFDVLFPSPDPTSDSPLPYYAWTFRRTPWNASPPVAFPVPLGLDGQLDLALRTVYRGDGTGLTRRSLAGSPLTEHRFHGSFTVDANEGRPKLQRGFYLLGLRPGVWDEDTALPSAADQKRATDLCSLALSIEPIVEG